MCYMCDDPIPDEIEGDPDTVEGFATAFTSTAQALRDAARDLRAVANESITISLAIDEVREKADGIEADTDKVAERYEGAGTTFAAYATSLRGARALGNGARANMISNNEESRYWRHRERDLRLRVQLGASDAEVLADFEQARGLADQADRQYSTYLTQYRAAVEAKDAAVQAAIGGLDNAAKAAGLDDGFFDRVLGDLQQLWELVSEYIGPYLEVLREVLTILKKIVDALALIVTVLAIFFPMLAPIALALTALSAVIGIAIFAMSLLLFAMGRTSLGTVIADGIMAVVGVVAAKVGGASSLRGAISDGVAAVTARTPMFVTRGAMIQAGSLVNGQPVLTYSAQIADDLAKSGLSGGLSAKAGVATFLIEDGLDFTLGENPPAWGASADESDPLSMMPNLLDSPTFGAASPVFGVAEIFQEHVPAIQENWGEGAELWSDVNVVPAV